MVDETFVDFPYDASQWPVKDSFIHLVEVDCDYYAYRGESIVRIDRASRVRFDRFSQQSGELAHDFGLAFDYSQIADSLVGDHDDPAGGYPRARVLLAIDGRAKWKTVVAAVNAAATAGFGEVGFVFAQSSKVTTPAVFWSNREFFELSILGIGGADGRESTYQMQLWRMERDLWASCFDVQPNGGLCAVPSGIDAGGAGDMSVENLVACCGCGEKLRHFEAIRWAKRRRQFGRPQSAMVIRIRGAVGDRLLVSARGGDSWSEAYEEIAQLRNKVGESGWVSFESKP
jgi:hypothetical protein